MKIINHQLSIINLLLLLAVATTAAATDSTRWVLPEARYSISGSIEYAYNKSWGHFANIDAQALLPINKHFEMNVNLQASIKNVYSVGVVLRPKFPLPVGELFFDTEVLYKAVLRANQMDLVTALSLGWRFDYLSVQIGSFCRVMENYGREWNSEEAYNIEPFNLLYRLEVFCRPQAENWNISAVIANFDDYQFERMWQLLFMLNGRYDIDDHWRVQLLAECKPTGMFHLNAAFYGFTLRAGFTYRF